jgi:hypothetical protein
MSFYNSGFKRVLDKATTTRAKVKENKKDDDVLKAAVDINSAKTGITSTQAGHITSNNSKVSMVIGTSGEQAMAGNTTVIARSNTSVSMTPSGAIADVMTFTIDAGYLVFTFDGNTYKVRAT